MDLFSGQDLSATGSVVTEGVWRDLDKLTLTPNRARLVWSGIAEPGELRTGALVQALGPQGALRWAAEPFQMPRYGGQPLDDPQTMGQPEEPRDRRGLARLAAIWRRVHSRLQPRLEEFDLEGELAAMESAGGRLVFPDDPAWPSSFNILELRTPFALWVVGQLPDQNLPKVALVGARAATAYGAAMASSLGYDCVDNGMTVISGGAYGIDAAAHRGALRPESDICPTVAVLCGGMGNPYPAGNTRLFDQIVAKGGALVTEMPPSARPARWRFLERNRLISAWAQMVVVVEASQRSGALATANRALEVGVSVGAVPGPATSPASSGTNELLKSGATVVTGVEDILFSVTGQPGCVDQQASTLDPDLNQGLEALSPFHRRVWDALPAKGAASVRTVASASGLSAREVSAALALLESQNFVKQLAEGWERKAVFP